MALVSGSVCDVPRFVVDASQRILDNVGVEGLFRKAGSTARQKEIRVSIIRAQMHIIANVQN